MDEWPADAIEAFFVWLSPRWRREPYREAPPAEWRDWLALQVLLGVFADDGHPGVARDVKLG